jgi:hypothetical protein
MVMVMVMVNHVPHTARWLRENGGILWFRPMHLARNLGKPGK